jgi:ATP-dependent DNA helicase RecG
LIVLPGFWAKHYRVTVLKTREQKKKMANIDLIELSARESERVEWKENVANIHQLIKTIVAFANDISNLGGGYVVCGAREGQDEHGFQQVIFTGLTSSRLKEIEGKVLRDCRTKVTPPIIPVAEEIPVNEDRRIIVFIVPATGNAHSYRAGKKDSSTYYIRVGRETLEARNSLLTELLVKKNQLEPWDHRINKNAAVEDIDLVALREYLQEMKLWSDKKTIDNYLSPQASIASFIPSLTDRVDLGGGIHPRNFALIMFGRDPLCFFRGAYTIYSIYPGKDRSEPTAKRHEVTGTVVRQAYRLIEMLEAEAYTIFDKTSKTPNVSKYPLRALQETVINALVHRDYESYQPIRITVFSDRVEINSPGALPRSVEKKQFLAGQAAPFWKNQTLAYFFNKLQLAQAEGQGIPTIYRLMKGNGNPQPIFEFGPENVICTLTAHPRHLKL